MARRLFLHIGPPKTGTTYLQEVLWKNKERLRELGYLLPLEGLADHWYASIIVCAFEPQIQGLSDHDRSAWKRLLEQTSAWDGSVIISHELFAPAGREQAATALEDLGQVADEVHIVCTARDLARQIPAVWQEEAKLGSTRTLHQFVTDVCKPDAAFFQLQGLAGVLSRWSQGLPKDRVHIVTVPRSGSPRNLLWERFAQVLELAPDDLNSAVEFPNQSLGAYEVAALRRINEFLPPEASYATISYLIRDVLAQAVMARRDGMVRFASPPETHKWIRERALRMVKAIRRHQYQVVGDLNELIPDPAPASGTDPDAVPDDAVLAVVVESLAPALFRSQEVTLSRLKPDSDTLAEQLQELRQQFGVQ